METEMPQNVHDFGVNTSLIRQDEDVASVIKNLFVIEKNKKKNVIFIPSCRFWQRSSVRPRSRTKSCGRIRRLLRGEKEEKGEGWGRRGAAGSFRLFF